MQYEYKAYDLLEKEKTFYGVIFKDLCILIQVAGLLKRKPKK